MQMALGRELPTSAEILQRHELERQNQQQVRSTKDAVVEAPSQTPAEASVPPLNASDDALLVIEDSVPSQTIVEAVKRSHSSSPQDDERNREYLIRRAALGQNPTQDEMDAVVAYGLIQHRINFPQLY